MRGFTFFSHLPEAGACICIETNGRIMDARYLYEHDADSVCLSIGGECYVVGKSAEWSRL